MYVCIHVFHFLNDFWALYIYVFSYNISIKQYDVIACLISGRGLCRCRAYEGIGFDCEEEVSFSCILLLVFLSDERNLRSLSRDKSY